MSTLLNLDYFYGTEAEQYTFYRIPKILFTDARFKDISVDSKVLYGLMLDRMGLSMKNSWLDKDNKVFIYFTLEDAMELMGYGHTKVIKLLSELDTIKGIGLIERKKQGQGKPTIIYVKSFSSVGTDNNPSKKEVRRNYPKPNFKTSTNEKSENEDTASTAENDVKDLENTLQKESFDHVELDSNHVSTSFPHNAEVLTSIMRKSGLPKNGSLDFSNAYTNKTYVNNTEFSDTQSINLSKHGLMDRVNLEELESIVYVELFENQTLPYHYLADENKAKLAIHILTEYKTHTNSNLSTNSFEFSVFKLFNEALIEMLTSQNPMILKGSHVTYGKVYDKLIPYITFECGHCHIYELQETAIQDFTSACKEQEIRNHLQYMKSVIWNAMQVGDIGIQSLIKKDFG